MYNKITYVDRVKIISLINNSPKYDTYLKGCFGVSFWVEVQSENKKKVILFDVGPLAEPLIYNAKMLGLNLANVDMIVLSHCHFDHTAALAGVVSEIGHQIPIFAHPDIFRPNFVLKPEFMNYGMVCENSKENIERLGGYFVLCKSPIEPFPGVIITGEVEKTSNFEESGGVSCFSIDKDGYLVPDRLQDDFSLIINVATKGLVIITGCAHAGVVNIIKHSIKYSGVGKLEGILGGFHLMEAEQERVDSTVEMVKQFAPNWVAPTHCTGIIPTGKFALAFKNKFREINAGDVIEVI